MITDPISDFLIQLKNASRVGKESVVVPSSKLKLEIANLLEREGYLKNVAQKGKKVKKYLYCVIVYNGKEAKLKDVSRVSKPSRRIYVKTAELKPVRQGYGLAVVSTPRGVMTEKEAKQQKVGGEHLFNIW